MRPQKRTANPCLRVLIDGAGFHSIDRFAEEINARAWHTSGMRLAYDHISVKRWLRGGTCQYPEVVAAVLSDAWGIPIPVAAIWPELRDGTGPIPAHYQAWVAARTLEDLGVFVRCDMLTRRDLLTDAFGVVTGTALTDPVNRWLPAVSAGIPAATGTGTHIDVATVVAIEGATERLGAADEQGMGKGLSREATVGQLKYTVDLMRNGYYTEQVGNRLLAAIGKLANTVGWISHDMGMEGPAQQYFVYGLQAARESNDQRGPLVAVGILADMARQMRSLGHPDTGLRLVDHALDLVPPRQHEDAPARSLLLNLRARLLATMGVHTLPEVRSCLAASFDLYAGADRRRWTWQAELFPYISDAEFAGVAAVAYRDLALEDPTLAREAERYAQRALAQRPDGFTRSRVFDQIALARARFIGGEPEQACDDAETAIAMSADVASSTRVRNRLRELAADSRPYADVPKVRAFRDHLQLVVSGA